MDKNNHSFPESPTHRYILDLQAKNQVDGLWRVFLLSEAVGKFGTIQKGSLVFRAGIYFKALTFDLERYNLKSEAAIEEKSLATHPLTDTGKGFEYVATGRLCQFFQHVENYWCQLDLEFASPIEEHITGLLVLVHIFCNQLFLLLKIRNFEYHAIKDDITQAYNQKYLRTFIQNEIERARRFTSVFSIIFFDLDNLKAVNEKYGHLVGTEVLKEVAEILRDNVRKIDVLSRFGGDEFVIVLLHTEGQRAFEACERIREKVNNHVFLKDKELYLKIGGSFGISSFPKDGGTVEDLISKADKAMYDVKHKGKNGIKIYDHANVNEPEKPMKEKNNGISNTRI